MRSILLSLGLLLSVFSWAQPCNLSDASGCDCADGSNACDLLPDIGISRDLLLDASENPEVYGELGVSVSTPNTGHGPLRVTATDYYICSGDTIYSPGGYSGLCSDGTPPRQLINQRIYQKNADGSMTYYERAAGSMTYHESHGHMHVDDWGVYSLRQEIPGLDPLDWPILAEGAKLGFCLMDYGSCSYYYGHCRDDLDNVLTTDAPNYGLGGGSYSCGISNQGISAGWTDIYYHYLDGMQIPIPPTMCNGDYMLVVHVDPYNYFLEENEDNNVVAVPITLTQQGVASSFEVAADSPIKRLCYGESLDVSVPFYADSYTWSNGETSQAISITESGTYSVEVYSSICGTSSSDTIEVIFHEADMPILTPDTICNSGSATLEASASGMVHWYDAEVGGSLLGSGSSFNTPTISSSTTYWAESEVVLPSYAGFSEPHDHLSTNLYNGSTFNGYLIFDALTDFTLKSVKVITDEEALRTIELRDENGFVIDSRTVNIPVGTSRVTLDFDIPFGKNYQLGTNDSDNNTHLGHVSPQLQRSNDNVVMPYVTPDIVSIHNSSAGIFYYYYFYDWEIEQESRACPGPRSSVEAYVKVCTGIEDYWSGSLSLMPNPSNQQTQIQIDLLQATLVQVQLIDLSGRIVYSERVQAGAGTFQYALETADLSAGSYFLNLQAGEDLIRDMLIVQH